MAVGLGTNNMTATTNAVFIPTIWGAKINDFYRADLVCAKHFLDLSNEVLGGGNIVKIPNMSQMTANTKTVTSQVTLNAPTEGTITLTIDTWKEVSFLIEDIVAAFMKKSYMMQERFARNAGYTVAATLEDAIIALFIGFSQTVGDSATTLNDSNIRAAIAYLEAADVPREDLAFFLHPNVVWNQIMGIDKFTLVTNTDGANNPVTKGFTGLLYGIPVYTTSRLGTYTTAGDGVRNGALAGKEAIAYATANVAGGDQPGTVRVQTQYLQDYLGTLVTADIIFGVIENRDTAGVWIKTKS